MQASVLLRVRTIFEDLLLGREKWHPAVWLIANSKTGISSHELGRALAVIQKSACFMLHRIRLAMHAGILDKFDGIAEVDETFVGGEVRSRHAHKRAENIKGSSDKDRTISSGALGRGGRVRSAVIPDRKRLTLHELLHGNANPGTTV